MNILAKITSIVSFTIISAGINASVTIETDMVDKEYKPIIEACMSEWASTRKNTGYVRPHYMDFQGDRYLIMYNGVINVRSPYGHMEPKIINSKNFICNLNSEHQKNAQDIEQNIKERKKREKENKASKHKEGIDIAGKCAKEFEAQFPKYLKEIGQPKTLTEVKIIDTRVDGNKVMLLADAIVGYGLVEVTYRRVLECLPTGGLKLHREIKKQIPKKISKESNISKEKKEEQYDAMMNKIKKSSEELAKCVEDDFLPRKKDGERLNKTYRISRPSEKSNMVNVKYFFRKPDNSTGRYNIVCKL